MAPPYLNLSLSYHRMQQAPPFRHQISELIQLVDLTLLGVALSRHDVAIGYSVMGHRGALAHDAAS